MVETVLGVMEPRVDSRSLPFGVDFGAFEGDVSEVEFVLGVGRIAVEADGLAEGEGYLEVGIGGAVASEDDGGGGVEAGGEEGYGVVLELAGAGGAGAGAAGDEDVVEAGGGDGVASVVIDGVDEFDVVGAAGAVETFDFIVEGIDEVGAVGGEIGVGVEAGGGAGGVGEAVDIKDECVLEGIGVEGAGEG